MTTAAPQIIGRKPHGPQAPDGTHRWATRHFADGTWLITVHDGWLIESETTTTSARIAETVWAELAERFNR